MCVALLLVLMSPGHLVFMCLMSFLVHCTCVHGTPFYVLSVLLLCLVFACAITNCTILLPTFLVPFYVNKVFLDCVTVPGVVYYLFSAPARRPLCVFLFFVYINSMQGCVLTAHPRLPISMCIPFIVIIRQCTTNPVLLGHQ